ncbi:MAG: hypothetical protein AAF591_16240 [Verrucomicrobiota bacterium]
MSTGKIILLNILILVVGISAYYIYQGKNEEPPPASDPTAEIVADDNAIDGVVSFDNEGGGVEEASDLLGTKLIIFIVGGVALGIILMMYVIPAIAGAASNFAYSAPEKTGNELGAAAVAKLAQGDLQGAIDEYKKLIEENPTDRFPVVEAAKIYVERMGDIDGGVAFLEESLNDKDWPVDDAAFLMFRIVDIETAHRENIPRAKELLTIITQEFENTRHAANAQHKLNELARAADPTLGDDTSAGEATAGDASEMDRLPPRTGFDETTADDASDMDRLPPRT